MSDRRSRGGRASWPPSGPRLQWNSYAAALENAQTRQVDRPEEWSQRSLITRTPRTFERPSIIVMTDFVRENLGLRDAPAIEAPAPASDSASVLAAATTADGAPQGVVSVAWAPESLKGATQVVHHLVGDEASTNPALFGDFLGILGSILHDSIMAGYRGKQDRIGDLRQLLESVLRTGTGQPLYRLLYAMATGQHTPPDSVADAHAHRVILGVAASAQILANLATNRVQPVQELVAALLHDSSVPIRVRETITRLALATSRATTVHRRRQDIASTGDPMKDVDPDSFIVYLFDNLQFGKLGGMHHLVVMLCHEVPRATLVKMGLMNVSNDAHDLESVLPTPRAYLPAAEEYKALAKRVAARLGTLLALHLEPLTGAADEGDDVDEQTLILDVERRDAIEQLREEGQHDQLPVGDGLEVVEGQRALDAKFTRQAGTLRMDRPLAANLAQEATVLNVISRAAQTGRSGRFSRGARPDHGLGIGLVCDGQPANQIPKLLREHGDNLGELIVGDAGFHMEKEVWTAIGKLFDEVFLRFFVCEMPYGRRGQKGQDWVIKPGNPTAVRREFREAMMGMTYGAVEACRATMEDEPTPAQVHEFMLERAKKEPMAFVILSWTRWVEVALMVYDSKNIGAHGDYTLFRQARCLSSVLFAGSNCHGYVALVASAIECWATASDRRKRVLAELMFTMVSATGRALAHADEFVEWVNRDIRILLGKHMVDGREDHISNTIQELPKLLGALREKITVAVDPGTQDPVTLDPVVPNQERAPREADTSSQFFTAGRRFCAKHNIWGPGSVRRRRGKSYIDLGEGTFRRLDDGEPLNPDLLRVLTTATERLDAYYTERRESASVDVAMTTRFRMPTALLKDVRHRATWEASRRTSSSGTTMMSTYAGVIGRGDQFITVAMALEELEMWRVRGADVETMAPDARKQDLVDELSHVRRNEFKRGAPPCTAVPAPTTVVAQLSKDRREAFLVDGVSPASHPFIKLEAVQDIRLPPAAPAPAPPPPPVPPPTDANILTENVCGPCAPS